MTLNKALTGIGAYKAYKAAQDWPADFREFLLDRLGLEEKNPTATVLGGLGFFALGVLIGGALGLVFAPMSGSEMRTAMREQGFKGVVDKSKMAVSSTIPSA